MSSFGRVDKARYTPQGVEAVVWLGVLLLATAGPPYRVQAAASSSGRASEEGGSLIAPRRAIGWEQTLQLSPTPSFEAVNLTTQHHQVLKSPIYTSDEQQQRMFSSLHGPRSFSSMAWTRAASVSADPTAHSPQLAASDSADPTSHTPQLAQSPLEGSTAESVGGLDPPFRFLPLLQGSLRNFQPNASLPRAFQILSLLPWTNGNASQHGAPSPSPESAAGPSRIRSRGNQAARRAGASLSAFVKNLSFSQLTGHHTSAASKEKGVKGNQLDDLQISSFLQDLPEDLLTAPRDQGQHALLNALQFQEARPDFAVDSNRTYINPGPPTHLLPDQPGPLIPLNQSTEGNATVRVQNGASVRAGREASLQRPTDISGWPADPLNTEGRPASGSWAGQEAGTHGTEALTHNLRTEIASLSSLQRSPPISPGSGDASDRSSQSAGQMLATTEATGSPSGGPVAQATSSPLAQPSFPTPGPLSEGHIGQFNGPVPMPLPPVSQFPGGFILPDLGPAPGPFLDPAVSQLAPGPFLPALPTPLPPALGPALPLQGTPTASDPLPRPIPESTTAGAVTNPQPGPGIQAAPGTGANAQAPSLVHDPLETGHEATTTEACVRVSHVLPTGAVFVECMDQASPSQALGIVPLWEASTPSAARGPAEAPQAGEVSLAGDVDSGRGHASPIAHHMSDLVKFGIGVGVCACVAALLCMAVFCFVSSRKKRKYDSKGRRLRPDSPSSPPNDGTDGFFPPLLPQTTSRAPSIDASIQPKDPFANGIADPANHSAASETRKGDGRGSSSIDFSRHANLSVADISPPTPTLQLHPASRVAPAAGYSVRPANRASGGWNPSVCPPPLPLVPATQSWSWLLPKTETTPREGGSSSRRAFSASSEAVLDPELGLKPSTSVAGSPQVTNRSNSSAHSMRSGLFATAPALDTLLDNWSSLDEHPAPAGTADMSPVKGPLGMKESSLAGASKDDALEGKVSSSPSEGHATYARHCSASPGRDLASPDGGSLSTAQSLDLPPAEKEPMTFYFQNPLAQEEDDRSRSQTPSPGAIPLAHPSPTSSERRPTGERGRSASPLKKLFLMAVRGEVAPSFSGTSASPPEASTSGIGQRDHGASSPSFLLRSNTAQIDVSYSVVETQASSFYDAAEMRTGSHQSSQLFYSMSESDMLDSVSAGTIISTTWTPMLTPTGSRPVTPDPGMGPADDTISTSPVPEHSPPLSPNGFGKRVRDVYLDAVRISGQSLTSHSIDVGTTSMDPEGRVHSTGQVPQLRPSSSQGSLSRASSAIQRVVNDLSPRLDSSAPSTKRRRRDCEVDPEEAVNWILDP